MKTPALDRWFVVKITAKSGTGASASYGFAEWWLLSGAYALKAGGRTGTLATNAGYSVGAELTVGDFALCRSADGEAARKWELVPIPGGVGGCAGCGWVAGLTDLDCLLATVVERLGRCACGGGTNSGPVYLTSGDGLTWTDANTITICGVEYALTFSKEGCDGPCLTLTSAGGSAVAYTTTRDCCGPNYAIFSIGATAVCTGTTDATAGPVGNTARVKVEWTCCPATGYDGPGYYCVRDAGTSGACVAVEVLSASDVCADAIEICSGPYATLLEAQAVCPDPSPLAAPGLTCGTAGVITVGMTGEKTVTGTDTHWYVIEGLSPGDVRHVRVIRTGGTDNGYVGGFSDGSGAPCTPGVYGESFFTTALEACVAVTVAGGDDRIVFEVHTATGGTTTYTLTVETGAC